MSEADPKGAPLGVGEQTRWWATPDVVDMAAAPPPPRRLTLNAEPQSVVVDLNRTAIVVIDMQNDFCTAGGWVDHIGGDYRPDRAPIEPLQRLLPALRGANVPVIWVNWGNRPDLANMPPNQIHLYKNSGVGVGLGDPLPGNGARVPLEGVVPLAPSYDTVGWFARSADVLARAGSVLLGEGQDAPIERFWLAGDAFDMMAEADRAALLQTAGRFGASEVCSLFDGAQALWRECYRVLQGREIWRAHGDWIIRTRPRFASDIAARFADAALISEHEVQAMAPVRAAIAERVRGLVPVGSVLLVPTAPGPALRRDAGGSDIGVFYEQALALTSAAGHAGLPQISVPAARASDGRPLGLSVIGWAGGDAALLRLAAKSEG